MSTDEKQIEKQFYVYLLLCSDKTTYVGATINLNKRLRQHNKEIKGGAYATGSKVNKGETWQRACYVKNFPDWSSALQFEWKWKNVSRKKSFGTLPLRRRLMALSDILKLDKPTSGAKLFSEWEASPEVVFELNEAQEIFNSL